MAYTQLCEKLNESCVVSHVSSHKESWGTSVLSLAVLTLSPSLGSTLLITASKCKEGISGDAENQCQHLSAVSELGSSVLVWRTLCNEGK